MSTKIDLISLIYEYNPESPLFARIAKKMIDTGNLENAKEVIDKGIKLYPDYATAYFVYSLFYKSLGDADSARIMAEKGNEILNNSDTLSYYKKEPADIDSNEFDGADQPEEALNGKEFDSIISEFGEAFPDEVEPEPQEPKPSASNKIISETLANIHYSQGHLQEAKDIYEQLKKKNPDRVDFYNSKIEEIEIKIDSQN